MSADSNDTLSDPNPISHDTSLRGALMYCAAVFFDEEQRLSVNPVQFLGRYLHSTNTALAQRTRAVAAVDQAVLEEQLKKKGD